MVDNIAEKYNKDKLMFLKGLEKGFTMSINSKDSFDKIKKIKDEIKKMENDPIRNNTHIPVNVNIKPIHSYSTNNTTNNNVNNTTNNNVNNTTNNNVNNANIIKINDVTKYITTLSTAENLLKNKINVYQKNYNPKYRVYIKNLLVQLDIINNNLIKYTNIRNNLLHNLNNSSNNKNNNIQISPVNDTRNNNNNNININYVSDTTTKTQTINNKNSILSALISIVESL